MKMLDSDISTSLIYTIALSCISLHFGPKIEKIDQMNYKEKTCIMSICNNYDPIE